MNNHIFEYVALSQKTVCHIYTHTRTIGFSATSAYFRSIIYPQPRGTYSLPDDVLPCLDTQGAISSLPMYHAAVMKWPSITPVSSANVEVWKVHYIVYPKKYAHGFCFAMLCCGYTLTDFPISIRLTSLALWQSNDCPSASKATLMNMDECFMWIHYERLHNHNKAKHNKTVCIFLGIYCNSKQHEHFH